MRFMRTKAIALTLAATLCAAGARAEDPKAKPAREHQGSTGEHLDRAGKELDAAGKAAAHDAKQAADEARKKADEAARDTRDGVNRAADRTREGVNEVAERTRETAEEAAREAREAAHEAKEAARGAAEETREAARDAFERGKVETREALEEARERTRGLLLEAADALAPEERERARAERRKRWGELRGKLAGQPADPEAVNPALRAELKHHARRVARLHRVRAVAQESSDAESVARVDALLAKENQRHERRVSALTSSPAKEPTP
jgi:hypothetical protein